MEYLMVLFAVKYGLRFAVQKLNTTAHWEMSIINMITLHAILWSITDYKLQQYCKIYAIEVFGSFQFKDPVLLYE